MEKGVGGGGSGGQKDALMGLRVAKRLREKKEKER